MSEGRHARLSRAATLVLLVLVQHACVWWTATEGRTFQQKHRYSPLSGKVMHANATLVMSVRAEGNATRVHIVDSYGHLYTADLGSSSWGREELDSMAHCLLVSPTDGTLWYVHNRNLILTRLGPEDPKGRNVAVLNKTGKFGFCADYGGRAYFFDTENHALYSTSIAEMEVTESLRLDRKEMDLPSTGDFTVGYQLPNGAVSREYVVDLACVQETEGEVERGRCVHQWNSGDNTRYTAIRGDLLYSWDDFKLKAFLTTSENTVSPTMFLDRDLMACTLDPLQAYVFCSNQTGIARIRADDFSVVDSLDGTWLGALGEPLQMSMLYKDETAVVCMYSTGNSNGAVSCTSFVVSDCGAAGASCFDDPVYCRFDLAKLACRSVQSCTDAAVCTNSRLNATLLSSATTDVSSTESVVIRTDSSHALTRGSGGVQCRFAPGVATAATVTSETTVACPLPQGIAAGEYSVVLVAREQGLALTDPVPLVLYDCRDYTDCAACVADGRQCSWAYAETSCVHGAANGTGITRRDACPVLAAPAPAVVPQLGVATTVVVPAANVRAGHMSCVFTCDEEAGAAAANVTVAAACESTFCRCRYYSAAGFGPDRCHLTLRLYYADRAGAPHRPIATAAGKVEARKCAALASCTDCHVVPQCRWVVNKSSSSSSGTGFQAGCVANDTAAGGTVVAQCPAVTAHTTHVDMLGSAPQATATLAGTDHPETVYCVYGDGAVDTGLAATRAMRGDSVVYACAVPRGVATSTTESLALAVPSLAEPGAFVTYAAVGTVHLLYCARHRQCTPCAAEHSECGFVFGPGGGNSSSRTVCTWAGNASAVGSGTWSRTCFRSTAVAPRTLNAAGDVVLLGTGACFAFLDGRYNCTLAHTADGYVYQSVPLRCHNATAATCTFGASADADGAVPWSTTVTIAIAPAAPALVRAERAEEEEEDPLAEFARLTWTVPMLNCLSATSDCATCTGADLAAKTRGGCRWSLAQSRCVVGASLIEEEEEGGEGEGALVATEEAACPTLRTVPKEMSRRTKSFRVYGTNFRAAVPVSLVLVGAAGNCSCDAAVVAPTELRVSGCRDLPAEPQALRAVLVVANGNAYAAGTPTIALVRARFPLWAIVVLAVALLAVLAGAVAAAAVYARTHGGLRPYRFDVARKPDFGAFRWATDLWPAGRARAARSDAQWAQLRALLEDGRVRAAVCRATAATEADRFASAMVYAHAADARATDLVLALVHDEVQSVPGETQLFRGNSLASKAFRAYSRMVGLDYLWMTLARFVHELSHLADVQDQATRDEQHRRNKSSGTVELEESSGMHDTGGTTTTTTTTTTTSGVSILSTEFEVDPTKLAAGADEETQSYMLAQRARQLVVCIVQSTPHLPAELRFVAHRLAQEVGARFPGCERIAICGTFFLRFICPALLAPHCYALLMTPDRRRPVVPGDHLQRQLVLLGKVLQNLANGVLFGKKEPFMVRMNQFITRNLDTVGQWMDTISSDATPCREAAADVPRATLADSHQFLLAHVAANLGKIQASLEQAAAPPELFASLRDLVQA